MTRLRLLLLASAVACTVLAGAFVAVAPASATVAYPLDPRTDLPYPASASSTSCTQRPSGNICENVFLRALNRGRAMLGAPAYTLPKHFHSLAGADQLLVLANRDRKLYGRAPILGRNATLNASARRGAASGSDPAFVAVGGHWLTHGGSNWAGGTRSPLFAYLLWMYADQSAGWEHRHNVLMPSGSDLLIMGVGSGRGADGLPAWTALFESFTPNTLIEYVPTLLLLLTQSTDPPSVRILGLGFVHVRAVTFDGTPASFERISAGLLRATPPAHPPGRVHVQIVTRGGTSRLTGAAVYTY